MNKKLLHKVKQNKAFTLMETLIAVAVMVVLLGISIIGISNLTTSLKMAELDEHAKIIYLEAQNQLGIMEVEGALGAFHEDMRETYLSADRREDKRFLKDIYPEGQRPEGYPETADKMWEQMCYLKKTDDLSANLIAFTSDIYNNGGYYLFEFNPQTGDVYSVFYWESDEELTYEDVLNLTSRSRSDRADAKIGFYGGTLAGDLTQGSELAMDATLVNGEELYLKVAFNSTEELLNFYHTALDIKVTIQGEKGNVVTFEHMDLSNVVQTLDTIEFYMLLDSMRDGMHFDDIVNAGLSEDGKIIPGEKITIKVKSYFAHESGLWDDDTVEGNSLFANDTDEDTICITSLRHMINLNEKYFNNTHFTNAKKQISFLSNVDFDESAYAWKVDDFGKSKYVGYGKAERPFASIAPINNESLFNGSVVTGKNPANKYVLSNFVIQPVVQDGEKRNVGIFGKTEKVAFSNIQIADITVNAEGYTNVGSLVGLMHGGSITDCGVYLFTEGRVNGVETPFCKMKDEHGCNHVDEMAHRYDTFKVKGTQNVGGLVGCMTGFADEVATIKNSFAAIKVNAIDNNAGGLVGYLEAENGQKNLTIENCYASGDVMGNQYVGGFIGKVYGTKNADNSYKITVSSNYTTGNVYANTYFGGFLGGSNGASYKDATSYGEVFDKDVLSTGTDVLENANKVGGFINAEASTASNYVNCIYMIQNGYNTEKALSDPASITKKTYGDLLAASTTVAKPYNAELYLQAFPFATLSNQERHYGNWAEPFVIDTSLVYYERYADSSYGYYCVTTISDNDNIWVLNTLKDKTCVEDGYGLLTKYNLEKIDYDLYVGTEDGVTTSRTDVGIVTQNMVENGAPSEGKFIRLNQQGTLEFYAVDSYSAVYGKESAKTGETFEVSKLYLYQLPYELQCTNRMNVSYFYDRIQITAQAYGSSTKVIDGLSYLYCPHFAKTAVNPNVNEIEPVVDYQSKHENPLNIYIRSARQLNALGRFPYYWNGRGGLANGNDLTYIQETDINFSTYVKEYAGREFDLQAFGKEYSNRPIGDPDLAPTESQYFNAQFRNTFDGRSNKIIDYCVDGSWIGEDDKVYQTQFTGLFGEINDAELKNIVMVVSNNPKGNGGVITSSFLIDGSTSNRPWEGESVKRAGIGALVGLAYETSGTSNQITNCVASGYTVQYKMTKNGTGVQPLGIALGGLAGYSMSDMSNCAASNDVVLNMERDYIFENQGTVFIGGFAGSYYFGTIRDCYSAGTISLIDDDSDNSKFKYGIARLRVGTFCPGWMDTPASGLSWEDENVEYFGAYSITDVSADVWKVYEGSNGTGSKFSHYIPLVSRMVVCEDDTLGWIGDLIWGKRWTTDRATGMTVRAVGTKHVSDVVDTHLSLVPGGSSSAPKQYYFKNGSNGQTSAAISLKELKTITEANTNGVTYDLSKRAKVTYIDAGSDASIVNYPYPEVIYEVDANGNKTENYVHYGKWPTEISWAVKNFPTYYEKYVDGTYEFYYLNNDGTVVDTLIKDNSKEILETGYGVLTIDKASANELSATKTIVGNENGDSFTYYLTKFEEDFLYEEYGKGLQNNGRNLANISFQYDYTKVKIENAKLNLNEEVLLASKICYFNPMYGAALSSSKNLGKVSTAPLQVRTYEQLQKLSTTTENAYVLQTHNIDLKENNTSVNVNAGIHYDGNIADGCIIKNASEAVFGTNNGTIVNTRVDAVVNTNNAYGFVVENKGTISYSLVTGAVTGKSKAAGFVGNNTGSINNCYVNAQVKATNADGVAAGFAINSANTEKCYAAGTVNAATTYGFMSSGKANTCYTIVNQSGTNMYGFAGNSDVATATNCYWGYDFFKNYNVEAGKQNQGVGTRQTLSKIQAIEDYALDQADEPYDSNFGSYCPYPSVGVVHYGDWPVATRFNTLNALGDASDDYAGSFYYEKYYDEVANETIVGVYAKEYRSSNSIWGGWNENSTVALNTLMVGDSVPVVESGYGIYHSGANWNVEWEGQERTALNRFGNNIEGLSINGYSFYKIQNTPLSVTIRYVGGWSVYSRTFTWTAEEINTARNSN